jgi:hypothetical protein
LRITRIEQDNIWGLITLRHIREGRLSYLNAAARLRGSVVNGEVVLHPAGLFFGESPLSQRYLEFLKSINVLKGFYEYYSEDRRRRERVQQALMRVRKVSISAGRITLSN